MVSIEQIKAARTMLGWSAVELAKRCGIGSTTIKRYELQSGIPVGTTMVLGAIQETLEADGIEFIGDPRVNPGVILHLK